MTANNQQLVLGCANIYWRVPFEARCADSLAYLAIQLPRQETHNG